MCGQPAGKGRAGQGKAGLARRDRAGGRGSVAGVVSSTVPQ